MYRLTESAVELFEEHYLWSKWSKFRIAQNTIIRITKYAYKIMITFIGNQSMSWHHSNLLFPFAKSSKSQFNQLESRHNLIDFIRPIRQFHRKSKECTLFHHFDWEICTVGKQKQKRKGDEVQNFQLVRLHLLVGWVSYPQEILDRPVRKPRPIKSTLFWTSAIRWTANDEWRMENGWSANAGERSSTI